MTQSSHTSYRYVGPNSAMTLKFPDGSEQDVLLWKNTTVSLPSQHEVTESLLQQGLLEQLPAQS